MTTLYTEDANGGVKFSSERKSGEVWIPNYVYDLWLPLLGATVIGIYSTYCRLERGDSVKAKSLDELAYTFHVGKKTLLDMNKQLTDCGFIRVNVPTGHARLKHWTTEIIVLDPPKEVSAELIAKYRPKGYKTLCPWLVQTEVLPKTSDGANQNHDTVLDSTPKIASPELLNEESEIHPNARSHSDTPPPPADPPKSIQPGPIITQNGRVLGRIGDPLPPEAEALIHKPISAVAFGPALEEPPKIPTKGSAPHWQVYNAETGEISGTFDDRALAVTENRDLNKLGGAKFKLRKVEGVKPGKQPPQYGEVVVALVEAYWKLPIADVKRATMQRAGDVAKALLADFPDVTADEVRRSAKAFEDMSRNASLPLGTRTMVDWFARWRAQHKPKSGNEYLNDEYFKRRGETV